MEPLAILFLLFVGSLLSQQVAGDQFPARGTSCPGSRIPDIGQYAEAATAIGGQPAAAGAQIATSQYRCIAPRRKGR